MDDLTAFVAARLDEDEQYAQAAGGGEQPEAGGGEWTYDSAGQLVANLGQAIVKVANLGVTAFGWHIARHDPARVLREAQVKEARLRRYVDAARNAAERRAEGRPSPAVEAIRDALYVEVLHDATIWDDHPDYRPEWKP